MAVDSTIEQCMMLIASGRAHIMPRFMVLCKQDRGLTRPCHGCGVTVYPRRTPGGRWYLAAYCTRSCVQLHRRPPIQPQPCEVCGTMFKRDPGTRQVRRFCSRKCTFLGMRNIEGWTRKRHGYLVFWTGKAEVLVHRIVMEGMLGRELTATET